MIPHCRTPRSSNKAIVFLGLFVGLSLLLPATALAQFKGERDRKIVRDILEIFSHECVQHEATDSEIMKRLDVETKDANRIGNPATQKCFENHYSQVAGVFFLYQKICRDVSTDPIDVEDEVAATQLLTVNKYQLGIRPFHSTLNDCLIAVPEKKGEPFIVPLAGGELDVKVLEKQIDSIRIGDPFANTFPAPAR